MNKKKSVKQKNHQPNRKETLSINPLTKQKFQRRVIRTLKEKRNFPLKTCSSYQNHF